MSGFDTPKADITQALLGGKWEVKAQESDAELTARLKREADELAHDLRVRWWTFVVCLTAMVVIGLVGLGLLTFGGTPERERTGQILLTAIVSGAVGYLVRRTGK
jgi:hypothetical protein